MEGKLFALNVGVALARSFDPKRAANYRRWVFLSDQQECYRRAQEHLPDGCSLESGAGRLNDLYEAVKPSLLSGLRAAQGGMDDLSWWGGQVGSRSATATPLIHEILQALLARDILDKDFGSILFICSSLGLAETIRMYCLITGKRVRWATPGYTRFYARIVPYLSVVRNCVGYFFDCLRFRFLVRYLPVRENPCVAPRVLIRTWFALECFTPEGRYTDRHFGPLPDFFVKRGWQVVYLPMFVNPKDALACLRAMTNAGMSYLLPTSLLSKRQLLQPLIGMFCRYFVSAPTSVIGGLNVTRIVKRLCRRVAADQNMLMLNLVHPLLQQLAKASFRIDAVLYPFENNAPEKLLVLGVRASYPRAQIIGFQHSVWLSRQPGAELFKGESNVHPLPDRIVCSGDRYVSILAALNFPKKLLASGPSLRFHHVRQYKPRQRRRGIDNQILLFSALPYDLNLSIELIVKMGNVLEQLPGSVLQVKSHPLLDMECLRAYGDAIQNPRVQFVTDTCRECLLRADVAVNIGTSVVQMEAVAAGVPLVRITPDNTLFLDPMYWMDYPVSPANSGDQIVEAVKRALSLKGEDLFRLSEVVKAEYFNECSNEQMAKFLSIVGINELYSSPLKGGAE